MPNKKKKIFTKANSTKFVLITDGRDPDGNKITENYLMPVSKARTPGSSLLLAKMEGLCSQAIKNKLDEEVIEKIESKIIPRKRKSKTGHEKEPNLEQILEQMTDESDDEEEEDYSDEGSYDELASQLKKADSFFDNPEGFTFSRSNVLTEILDVESDFSDEFGQFSDAESEEMLETSCRLTSAKADCPESIQILNEGFEKILRDYDDNQIGALDDVEICGTFSTENEQMQNFITTPLEKPELDVIGEVDESIKKKILLYCEVEEPEHIIKITTERPIEWDCESILSTYSNKYNHPTIIKEESQIRKICIPSNPMKMGLTKSKLKQLEPLSESEEDESDEENDDKVSMTTSCNIRLKSETPQQKRERKAMFKEAKRESRKLKKENKLAFKQEKKIQTAVAMNIQKTRGIKLY